MYTQRDLETHVLLVVAVTQVAGESGGVAALSHGLWAPGRHGL